MAATRLSDLGGEDDDLGARRRRSRRVRKTSNQNADAREKKQIDFESAGERLTPGDLVANIFDMSPSQKRFAVCFDEDGVDSRLVTRRHDKSERRQGLILASQNLPTGAGHEMDTDEGDAAPRTVGPLDSSIPSSPPQAVLSAGASPSSPLLLSSSPPPYSSSHHHQRITRENAQSLLPSNSCLFIGK